MSELRAIVFDFDGVIVESTTIKTRAFAALFADRPEHVDAVVELHLGGVGLSRYEKFGLIYRDILDLPLPDEEMARLDRDFSRLVVEEILACPFVPGAPELLVARAANEMLFVASATPEQELRMIVDQRGLSPHFRGIFGSPASKSQIVQRIADENGLDGSEMMMIGDALSDLDAARSVGARFVGRRVPGEPLIFDESVPVVHDLAELTRRWDAIVVDPALR